ncbi:MAG: hypothetical protein AAGJ52_05885 [Pseudomonadota bacterium]
MSIQSSPNSLTNDAISAPWGPAFLRLFLLTGALLLVPLIAMPLTDQVNWTLGDFVIMALLILGAGSAFIAARRLLSPRFRLAGAVLVIALGLYLWAELAVGLLFDLGS